MWLNPKHKLFRWKAPLLSLSPITVLRTSFCACNEKNKLFFFLLYRHKKWHITHTAIDLFFSSLNNNVLEIASEQFRDTSLILYYNCMMIPLVATSTIICFNTALLMGIWNIAYL